LLKDFKNSRGIFLTDIIKNWIFGPSDFEEPDPVKEVKRRKKIKKESSKKIKKESSFLRAKGINKEKNKKLEQISKEEE
tara:strand:- start:730 stop:966 length:237 start_codon:yes stop_codon:yes gene_type:complete